LGFISYQPKSAAVADMVSDMPSIQAEISCCLPAFYSVAFTQNHTKLLSAKPMPSTSFAAKANTKQLVAD
jgi:hypothetical protein